MPKPSTPAGANPANEAANEAAAGSAAEDGGPLPADVLGPRGVIEQAARDVRRGLLDTDLHGTPSNVPGPHSPPEQSGGAAVPPAGGDRKSYGERQQRPAAADETGPPAASGKATKHGASATWTGGLKDGAGQVSTESGALDGFSYDYRLRPENGVATNPEELIAAAQASCLSVTLAAQLEKAGLKVESVRIDAAVTVGKTADGLSITAIHLDIIARVPGATQSVFDTTVLQAQAKCPVSKVLKAPVTLDTRLEA